MASRAGFAFRVAPNAPGGYDDYLERLMKMIPGESVGLYLRCGVDLWFNPTKIDGDSATDEGTCPSGLDYWGIRLVAER
jgi:hypothetical protein